MSLGVNGQALYSRANSPSRQRFDDWQAEQSFFLRDLLRTRQNAIEYGLLRDFPIILHVSDLTVSPLQHLEA